MSDTTPTKTRTITLTDRPPVTIREDDWPIIAEADYDDDTTQDCRPNRNSFGHVKVRRHADGRAIVYARYDYETRWQGERGDTRKAGVLLAADATTDDVIRAIKAVHAQIGIESEDWQQLAQKCIADLPAEAI